jgi:hypothetical protein
MAHLASAFGRKRVELVSHWFTSGKSADAAFLKLQMLQLAKRKCQLGR